jgi:hypothetical protein
MKGGNGLHVETIRIAADGCPQIGLGAVFPFVAEISAVDALEAHACDSASHHVCTHRLVFLRKDHEELGLGNRKLIEHVPNPVANPIISKS